MERLRFLTKKDSVAEALRQEIVRGAMRPGQRLAQDEIAARLHVSPTPVREAFSVLEAEGLIEVRPHRGAVVALIDSAEAESVYELRHVLEMTALRRTLRRSVDHGLIADLDTIANQVEEASPKADMHRVRAIQVRFHERLVQACGSEIWADVTKQIISRSLFLVPLSAVRQRTITRQHRGIVTALKRRDSRLAERRMDEHLRGLVAAVRAREPARTRDRAGTRSRSA